MPRPSTGRCPARSCACAAATERYDVLVDANLPGVWAFHCHVLSHVEGPQGMFGMATALVVT